MGAMGWTNTTLELKSAFSFMLSMKKSTKARIKLPSPNWMTRSGASFRRYPVNSFSFRVWYDNLFIFLFLL